MEISDRLLCLFSAEVTQRDGVDSIEIPDREVAIGDVAPGETYRVALLPASAGEARAAQSTSTSAPDSAGEEPAPPVEEGEVVDVEIETVGDQGDGIARVGPGFVLIVSDTEVGERVAVELTEVRQNMAFADVVERYDRR